MKGSNKAVIFPAVYICSSYILTELKIIQRSHSVHRKFISPYLLASFLISLIFLSCCGENSTSPSSGGFSFKLTVVDQDGAPISGLKLSRQCSIEYDAPTSEMNQARKQILAETDVWPTASLQSGIGPAIVTKSAPGADPPTEFAIHPAIPNPGTTFSIIILDVPVICNLGIKVLDWLGKEIQCHNLGGVPATSVSMGYRFIDEGDNPLPNGIYSVIYTATAGASTVLFTDSVYFSGYTPVADEV